MKRILLDTTKYALAIALLFWVIWANWAPPAAPSATRDIATFAAGSVGLANQPLAYVPLLRAVPEPPQSRGLGYVWDRHVVQGRPIGVGWFFLAFAIYLAAACLTFLRWYLLVRALDLQLSPVDAFRYGLLGVFFNAFLPGSVGGDIVKAAALARSQSRRTAAVATVIMDRIIALWALFWFVAGFGSLFWFLGLLDDSSGVVAKTIVKIALAVVGISLSCWLILGLLPQRRADRFAERLSHLPVIGSSAAEFWRVLWIYRQRQASVALVMVLSWIGQVGFVVSFFCCANTLWTPELGPIPSLLQHFILVPIGLVMQALVPTPGGAGGGEWGFAALYLLFHAAEANGVLASLVQRMINWMLGLGGYLIYVWTKPAVQNTEPTADSPVAPSVLLRTSD